MVPMLAGIRGLVAVFRLERASCRRCWHWITPVASGLALSRIHGQPRCVRGRHSPTVSPLARNGGRNGTDEDRAGPDGAPVRARFGVAVMDWQEGTAHVSSGCREQACRGGGGAGGGRVADVWRGRAARGAG